MMDRKRQCIVRVINSPRKNQVFAHQRYIPFLHKLYKGYGVFAQLLAIIRRLYSVIDAKLICITFEERQRRPEFRHLRRAYGKDILS